MRREHRYKGGFTIIELLITVGIIGTLCAISIPAYTSYREKGRVAQVYGDLKKIQLSIELLAADTERWPGPNNVGETADQEVWDLGAPNAGLMATNGAFPHWDGPYMDAVPADPWGQNYFFDPDYTINGETYAVIGSFGPNRVGPNLYDSDDIIIKLPVP